MPSIMHLFQAYGLSTSKPDGVHVGAKPDVTFRDDHHGSIFQTSTEESTTAAPESIAERQVRPPRPTTAASAGQIKQYTNTHRSLRIARDFKILADAQSVIQKTLNSESTNERGGTLQQDRNIIVERTLRDIRQGRSSLALLCAGAARTSKSHSAKQNCLSPPFKKPHGRKVHFTPPPAPSPSTEESQHSSHLLIPNIPPPPPAEHQDLHFDAPFIANLPPHEAYRANEEESAGPQANDDLSVVFQDYEEASFSYASARSPPPRSVKAEEYHMRPSLNIEYGIDSTFAEDAAARPATNVGTEQPAFDVNDYDPDGSEATENEDVEDEDGGAPAHMPDVGLYWTTSTSSCQSTTTPAAAKQNTAAEYPAYDNIPPLVIQPVPPEKLSKYSSLANWNGSQSGAPSPASVSRRTQPPTKPDSSLANWDGRWP
ncbi:hypothetical protein CVT26_007807 [Gymnopilus dilepis]|uniref:Uncharacterized protein n=1 Tax=Gymnopilus dilepis TaxID=231916 RepID=A0A409W7T6_9AGAR|nr:hypothetical protein CVT26_007807 [Gymnopilus dilepis]